MIDASLILSAIETVLVDDVTLAALLGTQEGDSKVFLGSQLPETPSLPLLLLPDPQLSFGRNGSILAEIVVEIQVWTQLTAVGREHFESLYPIASRVVTLLERKVIDAADSKTTAFFLSTASSCVIVNDLDACHKTLRFEGRTSSV